MNWTKNKAGMGARQSRPPPPPHPQTEPASAQKVRILLIGDSGVGAKTNLLVRYIHEEFAPVRLFPSGIPTTIGIDFQTKTVEFPAPLGKLKLQMWDTAGQERFHGITTAHIRSAHAVIAGYDITDQRSFDNIRSVWLPMIKTHCLNKIAVTLVGHKSDLVELRVVATQQGFELAADMSAELGFAVPFFETSAKDGQNVDECFSETAINAGRLMGRTIPDGVGGLGYSAGKPVKSAQKLHVPD